MNAVTQKIKARKKQNKRKSKGRRFRELLKLVGNLPGLLHNLHKKDPDKAKRIVLEVMLNHLMNKAETTDGATENHERRHEQYQSTFQKLWKEDK